jgi:hypothetical protein
MDQDTGIRMRYDEDGDVVIQDVEYEDCYFALSEDRALELAHNIIRFIEDQRAQRN